jgi:hypothetical protein
VWFALHGDAVPTPLVPQQTCLALGVTAADIGVVVFNVIINVVVVDSKDTWIDEGLD